MEPIAGLQEYNKMYQMASEVNHSSPLLIYSRREYFAMITILNLYDSFFRLENVFRLAYFSLLSEQEKEALRSSAVPILLRNEKDSAKRSRSLQSK